MYTIITKWMSLESLEAKPKVMNHDITSICQLRQTTVRMIRTTVETCVQHSARKSLGTLLTAVVWCRGPSSQRRWGQLALPPARTGLSAPRAKRLLLFPQDDEEAFRGLWLSCPCRTPWGCLSKSLLVHPCNNKKQATQDAPRRNRPVSIFNDHQLLTNRRQRHR